MQWAKPAVHRFRVFPCVSDVPDVPDVPDALDLPDALETWTDETVWLFDSLTKTRREGGAGKYFGGKGVSLRKEGGAARTCRYHGS
jgi:hypothetical protein